MIALGIYPFLAGKASIRAIVALSNASPQKASIYPQILPQKHIGYPAITYSLDDDRDDHIMFGTSGTKEALLSIDCWAYSYLSVHGLADAVCTELVGYRGTFGAHAMEFVQKSRELDMYEPDTSLHRVSLQFRVVYE